MKFATNPRNGTRCGAEAFTLAEVLAALLFMAIVIPVALQALQVSSRAGVLAERRREAARVAERILNESIVMTNWNQSAQSGVVYEGDREYQWSLRTESWNEPSVREQNLDVVTVAVEFPVRGEQYTVELKTLAAQP